MKLFSKTLTATDCLKRLSLPKGALTSLPDFHGGHAVELLVRCETMEYWPLVCTIRKRGYKKPVISKGWRKFVLGNRLNVGDELTLHKEDDRESVSLRYRVEVKRASSPSRALSQSPSPPDHHVDQITSPRSCKNVDVSDGIASVHGTDADNSFVKHVLVDVIDVMDVTNQDNSKVRSGEEQEREVREFKLFGSINFGGSLLVSSGTSETFDHKAYYNSLKQFGLSDDGAELVNSNGQAILMIRNGAQEETAIEHFNLGLTMGGAVVHVDDQATSTSSTSFYKTDQRLGFELDTIPGQSTGHRSVVNLDLTLRPPILIV